MKNRLRIAQVAPLFESVPPRYYGGTERVVSFLTEELVKNGHDVTLLASGDSITKARLVAVCEKALRLDDELILRGFYFITHQTAEVFEKIGGTQEMRL